MTGGVCKVKTQDHENFDEEIKSLVSAWRITEKFAADYQKLSLQKFIHGPCVFSPLISSSIGEIFPQIDEKLRTMDHVGDSSFKWLINFLGIQRIPGN
jgi:hypothetical protein